MPFGDLPAWFCHALGTSIDSVQVVRVFDGDPLPEPDATRLAIITGSWAMVTDRLPWSERAAQWIRDAMAIDSPLLGVCYGHQLISYALGGHVDYHPGGRELGCKTIQLLPTAQDDPLLKFWPAHFKAHLTHQQSVIELPPGARALAVSDHDPHQIVRYGPRAISTQFHPEFTPDISAACIRRRAAALQQEGKDLDAMLAAVDETPEASRLLTRFAEMVLS